MPSRGLAEAVTLTSTTVSPQRTSTEAFDRQHILPVSNVIFFPPYSIS